MSTIDVMAPWGKVGPPPLGEWREDLLGQAFQSRTIELLPDAEGDNVATLIKYRPHKDPLAPTEATGFPRFIVLYIHGRNDYFFQTEAARRLALAGATFYALDLRKYGRSLRPWQSIGYVDDLTVYDEEIGEALEIIRSEQGKLPLVLVGHSTGGLIATLWAHRHPGAVRALVLNSAWLEMQTLASLREAMQPVIGRIAARNPMLEIMSSGGPGTYGRSTTDGWAGSGFSLPKRLKGYEDDPAVVGWDFAREWKRPESYPVPAKWLDAIMLGHEIVEKRVHLECPVLSMMSTSSYLDEAWDERAFSSDTVLDVRVNAERSANLGDFVTIARFPGKHDLFLSDPDVREAVYSFMDRWLCASV
ncbi:alpha/beta hydrolase [Schaalia vaccimaxillae]|uniref:alpha/beta hydrolase n=1 Tax=Schaalia vaccimaxillae TaxID=183916 RepID=UPI0003B487B9|nr:alpha/beta hydrolase [Schaalia vaccimaxillae]